MGDTFTLHVERSTEIPDSSRVRQLEAMFDVPRSHTSTVRWDGDVTLPDAWRIGLLLGPSGSGKSTLLSEMFGAPHEPTWDGLPAVDNFPAGVPLEEISSVCQAVGFNTIPNWMRPYRVLSNGERFRVDLARTLVETEGVAVVDEFTSVVDRQVAKIGAHAVSKFVHRHDNMRFVAASCHYDIVEWLQPDWILEPHTMTLQVRSVQPRPQLDVRVYRTTHAAWRLFAPYHYLTRELHRAAQCFVLCVGDQPAAFGGVIHRPHPKQSGNYKALSRLVTLPDWQGLGLAFVLADTIGAAYKAIGEKFRTYPAHPALIRAFDRSPLYVLRQKPGTFASTSARQRKAKGQAAPKGTKPLPESWTTGSMGARPNAVFEYVGPALDEADAAKVLCR